MKKRNLWYGKFDEQTACKWRSNLAKQGIKMESLTGRRDKDHQDILKARTELQIQSVGSILYLDDIASGT